MITLKQLKILSYAGIFLLLFVFTTSCGKKKEEISLQKKDEVRPVVVQKIKRMDVVGKTPLMGNVRGFTEIDVFPKLPGKLLKYKVREWQKVKKGDVIAVVDLDLTGMNYKPSLITSPIDGVVGRIYLDKGELVNPPTMSKTMGTPVARIVQMNKVKVEIQIPENLVYQIRKGLTADILPSENRKIKITGKVVKVTPILDPISRTAQGEILALNKGWVLRPGMFVRVYVITEVAKNALAVPFDAVVSRNGKTEVMKVENGKVKEVKVDVGVKDSFVEVKNNLKEGDLIIVSSPELFGEGDKVKVIEVR